ncbi:spinster family MFS transporter [uncultured Sphingomonas sp.]|uniref:spinster family MFS transporter n=1 Tax=uncultured Sphingomonas sp. TaxID=158754 RepID=UPI0035CB3235
MAPDATARTDETRADETRADDTRASGYAWYVLGLLFLVYCLNFIDRQIISILAEDIKRDLHLADEDLGFLYGTAFGVFYALFGIPLGRLADNWHRVRLITLGLALWSAMTTLSGFARSGAQLSAARIGVGVGEATASPSAYSLISDHFPRRLRATALSIYSAGIYFGGGLSLGLGGLVVHRWNAAYPTGGPLGLVGWQAAFLVVGLPGLVLAAIIATLREPTRGAIDNLPEAPRHPAPFRAFRDELLTVVPPLTLIGAARLGPRALANNLVAAVVILAAVIGMNALEGWTPGARWQWGSVGIGVYAVVSWGLALKRRDPATWALVIGSPAFVCVVVAYGLNAFIAYGVSFWAAPYALRILGQTREVAGFIIGGNGALGGLIGVTAGGIVADRLRRRYATGRQMVVLFGSAAPLPLMVVAFTTASPPVFYVCLLVTGMLASCALGASAATTQDLVLPRMRGTATATFFLGTTLLGLAIGPYMAGRISTLSGSLSTGVLSMLAVAPIGLAAAIAAYRLVPAAEASRVERARNAGEPV